MRSSRTVLYSDIMAFWARMRPGCDASRAACTRSTVSAPAAMTHAAHVREKCCVVAGHTRCCAHPQCAVAQVQDPAGSAWLLTSAPLVLMVPPRSSSCWAVLWESAESAFMYLSWANDLDTVPHIWCPVYLRAREPVRMHAEPPQCSQERRALMCQLRMRPSSTPFRPRSAAWLAWTWAPSSSSRRGKGETSSIPTSQPVCCLVICRTLEVRVLLESCIALWTMPSSASPSHCGVVYVLTDVSTQSLSEQICKFAQHPKG